MTYADYLKHAWKLYYDAVDAEGEMRKHYLQQARNVLLNVPDHYENCADLRARINAML